MDVHLVATGQIPHQRAARECLKHRVVTQRHQLLSQQSTQRITHMRVGPRLVQQQVNALAVGQSFVQPRQIPMALSADVLPFMKMPSLGVVVNPAQSVVTDEFLGAVAVVHVQVDDADPLHQPLGLEFHGGHDEAVESAVATGHAVARMVKPAGG